MNKLQTEDISLNNHFQVSSDSQKYVMPMDWYLRYVSYKKGGEHPGRIILSPLLTNSHTLNPSQQEGVDYRLVTPAQWTHFSKIFGKDSELAVTCRKPSFRSVSSGGYADDTFPAIEIHKFPTGARKSFEFASEVSSDLTSKPTSMDVEAPIAKTFSISSKLSLSSFANSSPFNSVLQLMMTIEDMVEFITKLASFGDCYNSEFLLQLSMIFLSGVNSSSGVIDTEFFYKNFRFSISDPGQMLQTILNKLEVETCKSSSINMFLNGIMNKEIQCLACAGISSFDSKFTYLALKAAKSIKKSFEFFSRHVSQKSFCCICNKENDSCTRSKIVQFPKYLIVVLKRWEEEGKVLCSFRAKIKFNEEYRLLAVVSQVNKDIVAFCKRNKYWTSYQGEEWKKVQITQVLASHPYVLLYKIAN